LLTAATTSRQWVKAKIGYSISKTSQSGVRIGAPFPLERQETYRTETYIAISIYLLYNPGVRVTQAERRTETRDRLLAAAASLFAQRGVAGVSVNAVAELAERTSGAVYDHFGSKEGLLVALLDQWKQATADVIAAEFEAAETLDERLAALWQNFVAPPEDSSAQWVLLEHELWLYACRNAGVSEAVAERYANARARLAVGLSDDAPDDDAATLLIALVIGLEMQRRLDPGAVTNELALRGLRRLV
jgi:AcrR family transcriptional regulator